jgi:hypothetical protein
MRFDDIAQSLFPAEPVNRFFCVLVGAHLCIASRKNQ